MNEVRIGLLGMADNEATPILCDELAKLGVNLDAIFLLKPNFKTQRQRLIRKIKSAGVVATVKRIKYALLRAKDSGLQPDKESPFSTTYFHTVSDFNEPEAQELIRKADLDLLLLHTDTIIKRATFTIPRIGCLNAHPGWLPMFRGLGSTASMLRDGYIPAITAHFINEGIDTGPVILRKMIPVEASTGGEDAEALWISQAALIFQEVIQIIREGKLSLIDTFLEPSSMTRGISSTETEYLQKKVRENPNILIPIPSKFVRG